MKQRKRTKYIFAEADLEPDRIIVSTVEHKGNFYMATQKGIYRLENDEMVRLRIVDKGIEDEQA